MVDENIVNTHDLATSFSNLGFSRLQVDGEIQRVSQILEGKSKKFKEAFLVVDRIATSENPEDWQSRLARFGRNSLLGRARGLVYWFTMVKQRNSITGLKQMESPLKFLRQAF